MRTHTADWRLDDVTMSCGHTMSVRRGTTWAFCPWCAQTVSADEGSLFARAA
ncbi:hypothetical protein [Nigerium massiliense]|uniref:hypothetical protein n=1 Tax=Nigerium massiliense TaxID=1522317 RepID=UPI0012FE0310|nr:hypothetical protein [Nigerium massiliense]